MGDVFGQQCSTARFNGENYEVSRNKVNNKEHCLNELRFQRLSDGKKIGKKMCLAKTPTKETKRICCCDQDSGNGSDDCPCSLGTKNDDGEEKVKKEFTFECKQGLSTNCDEDGKCQISCGDGKKFEMTCPEDGSIESIENVNGVARIRCGKKGGDTAHKNDDGEEKVKKEFTFDCKQGLSTNCGEDGKCQISCGDGKKFEMTCPENGSIESIENVNGVARIRWGKKGGDTAHKNDDGEEKV